MDSTNLEEQVIHLPPTTLVSYLGTVSYFTRSWIQPSPPLFPSPFTLHTCGYNPPPPIFDIKYTQLHDVGKIILNSEEVLHLPSLEYLKPLCMLIYSPTLN